ncbi:MAG: hypothetical protein WC584_00300 [Candidatus Pacearchaeota archaeon]
MDKNQRKIVEGLTLLVDINLNEVELVLKKYFKDIPICEDGPNISELYLASEVLNVIDGVSYFPKMERERLNKRYCDLSDNAHQKHIRSVRMEVTA